MEWTFAVTAGPEGGVEAGTLLGTGATDAAAHAGDGAVALVRAGGLVEIRAARDGAPVLVDSRVAVAHMHAIEGNVDRTLGTRAVRGSLRVGGHVVPGGELGATGALRLEGGADRATLRAGGELHIEGRTTGAVLAGGALTALRRRLHAPLRDVAAELDALIAMVEQVRAAGAGRGGSIRRAIGCSAPSASTGWPTGWRRPTSCSPRRDGRRPASAESCRRRRAPPTAPSRPRSGSATRWPG